MSPHSQEQAQEPEGNREPSRESCLPEGGRRMWAPARLGARPRAARARHPRASWGSVPQCLWKGPLAAPGLGWCGTDRTAPHSAQRHPQTTSLEEAEPGIMTPTALYVRAGPGGRARLGARPVLAPVAIPRPLRCLHTVRPEQTHLVSHPHPPDSAASTLPGPLPLLLSSLGPHPAHIPEPGASLQLRASTGSWPHLLQSPLIQHDSGVLGDGKPWGNWGSCLGLAGWPLFHPILLSRSEPTWGPRA